MALVWIAKTCTSQTLGQYALALAVVTPVLLFARMQLRYLLASQSDAKWGAYLRARILATGSCAFLLAATALTSLTADVGIVIALVAGTRAIEDIGDLLYGERQRRDDWDRIAGSQLLRGLGGAAALALGMHLGGTLVVGLAANLTWQALLTAGFDARGLARPAGSWAEAGRCLQLCWPLGAAAALVSLNGNLPRYALELFAGPEAVGHFAALSQLALVGNLPIQALGVAALAELGRRSKIGQRSFGAMIGKLALVSITVGTVGVIASWRWGDDALALLYTPAIAAQATLLIWVAGAALFTFLTAVFGYGLVSLGEKRLQMWVFGLSAAAGAAACAALVPGNGLAGATMANLVCWSCAAFLSGGALYMRAQQLPDETADCPQPSTSSTLNACSAPVGSSYPSPS